MKQPRQWYGVAMQSGSAALQKRLHIHSPSEGLSPGCSHPGCRNYQNPSKGRGCLSQLSPLDPKDPQSPCDLRMPPAEGTESLHLSRASLIIWGTFYPRGTGAALGIGVHRPPGLVHICTCPAPLALQTQEQQEPGGGASHCPRSLCGISAPSRIRVPPPGLCSVSEHLCYWVWSEDDPRRIFQK